MSRQQKGHDYSTILIWSAAVVTVVRYAAAFIASDLGEITGWLSELITILMGLSGLGMGILDVIGGTYLFDAVRRKMPKSGEHWKPQFKVLTGFVVTLMITGIGILVPFTVSRVTHTSMADVLSGNWLTGWAFLVNLAPYLLIGGVAVGNQVVSVSSQVTGNLTGNLPEDDRKLTGNFPNDWRQVRKVLDDGQIQRIATGKTEQICYEFGITDRNARNWRKYAQKELEKVRS